MKLKPKFATSFLIGLVLVMILLAGCNGFSDGNRTPTEIQTTDVITSESEETNTTESPSQNPDNTTNSSATLNKQRKYQIFADAYIKGLLDYNVTVKNSSIDAPNDTIHLTYMMKDPDDNTTSFWERKNISMNYYYGVDYFVYNDSSKINRSGVPNRVNVSALSPEGKLYETGYVTYENATELANSEISDEEYVIRYYLGIEPGPAHPRYQKENQTNGSEQVTQTNLDRPPEHKRFLRRTPPHT